MDNWKVLIVDDDEQIHLMTGLVLQDISFQGKSIELLSAYSAEEAKTILEDDQDIALILMDVVMETEHAGLDLVRYIREKMKNMRVRIILRTGQPGSAPEKKIIIEYDINDYKEKTELTFQKLFTTVISSLRTYDYISQLETQRMNLERLIQLNNSLFSQSLAPRGIQQSLEDFFKEMIFTQDFPFRVLIGQEDYNQGLRVISRITSKPFTDQEEGAILQKVNRGLEEGYQENLFMLRFRDDLNREHFLYLEQADDLNQSDESLFHIFTNNLQIAFSNISLQEEILDTQKDIITTLSQFIESRSTETAMHVFRVSKYCRLLGDLAGLDSTQQSILEIAAPMHDLGKVGISDDILKNPKELSEDEFERMKQHTVIGYEILKKSPRKILESAAVISHQHHEHWDGQGYPQGLKGEEIDILARIVTLADVFDALLSKRSYKEAWSEEEIREYLQENSGVIFDPRLVGFFLEHYGEFAAIAQAYPDSGN